ncbi:MAG: endo-1,4-beta-xylanase, partial [Planctomycetota bacterium]
MSRRVVVRGTGLGLAVAFAVGGAATGGDGAQVVVRMSSARMLSTGGAIGDGGWNLWANGYAGDRFRAAKPGKVTVEVLAAGEPAKGVWPLAEIWVGSSLDDRIGSKRFTAGSRDYRSYRLDVDVEAGELCIVVRFLNDVVIGKEDRNLLLREMRVRGAALAKGTALDTAIAKHRTGEITVRARPGARVRVTQLRHEFWFGTAIAASAMSPRSRRISAKDREKYLEVLKENFNCAVHENAMKWYSTEKQLDRYTYENCDDMIAWCEENGLRVRGHCVYWASEKRVQQWIKDLDDRALRAKVESRARDLLTRYRGHVQEYDVNNEMVHNSFYLKRLGADIRPQMFRWCREADPDAILYVNDYGMIAGGSAGRYVNQIEGLLKAGAPVGGIGVQGHFGGRVDARKVKTVLDRLARFKLPIKITEFDINTKDERAKARGLRAVY